MTEDLIRKQIQKLIAVWSQSDKYPCKCLSNQTYSLDCCRLFDPETLDASVECYCLDGEKKSRECCTNNFYPEVLNVLFDEIESHDVVRSIVEQIDPFLRHIFTEKGNKAFTRWNNPNEVKRWNWTNTGHAESATRVSGLYMSTQPIMKYDPSEVGYPFKNSKTIWETCEGLLRQVMFTMPLGQLVVNRTSGDWMWTAATVLAMRNPEMQFDPLSAASDEEDGLSYLERFVQRVLSGAFQVLPQSHTASFWCNVFMTFVLLRDRNQPSSGTTQ